MPRARISEKGQVTIPVAVRRSLGIGPGDEVGFTAESEPRLIPLRRSRVEDLFGVLAARRRLPGQGDARRALADELAQRSDRRARRAARPRVSR